MKQINYKKLIISNIPYVFFVYLFDKVGQAVRLAPGADISEKILNITQGFSEAFSNALPSVHPLDLLIGIVGAVVIRLIVYFKGKNARKYRKGAEYGSARWGNAEDIKPYIDPDFQNNIILTQTERLTMNSRPKQPKYARNKNVVVIGGSGSGKTRFFVKPNLMQLHSSYVLTDPKGTVLIECGKLLQRAGYRIKVLNTINFRKSMHYNPFVYIRSEKDVLKVVNTLIVNTKGEGEKSAEDFWVKAERLLYCALIGYIWYEAPAEEMNFTTLLELINASEAREDDEEYQSPVDLLFADLEERSPDHFAVKQYKKYKLAAGAAEKTTQRISTEVSRHFEKGAEKKTLDAAQLKTHTSRLQFSEAERATPELQKAIKKSDTAADRLDKARAAIPKQTKITKERVFDEAKGKAKTRLAFEKTDKPPNGKLRHNPLSRPAQELDAAVHGKIYEVEKENVGVESGHRIELVGEKAGGMTTRAVKRGIRSHKLKPYRAAAAAEKKAAKANADFLYQKALHDNPALAHSNPISRFWQKQRIKKQYAKALKTGGKVKKTAEATAKAAKKTAQETKRATFFVVRHWKGCLIVGGIAFIVLLFFGGLSSCSLFGGNSGSGLIASSYLSEDADITGAESAYVAMEAELQDMLDNIESEYPGYDEYRVTADEIEHDPYVLISILSAWHEGVFTLDEAQSTLEMLFDKQYILTVTEEVEVRYRTETRTDSEGNEYDVEVPYNYYILNVDLENFNLSHVPVYIMGEEQLSMYAMYMSSLGNRPDLFPQSGYISKYYENPPADYEIPPAYLEDEQFARLIEEAEKYVGFPYVWGGSSPETSFDCSGFVSYVLTNSGLYNTGRLGAQGLYNISTRVSNPQPGDLVFFTGTYDTPGVSHVGIYVGEDGDGSPVMLHCGDPIQYAKLDTSYWQSHFYAYGRLHYN